MRLGGHRLPGDGGIEIELELELEPGELVRIALLYQAGDLGGRRPLQLAEIESARLLAERHFLAQEPEPSGELARQELPVSLLAPAVEGVKPRGEQPKGRLPSSLRLSRDRPWGPLEQGEVAGAGGPRGSGECDPCVPVRADRLEADVVRSGAQRPAVVGAGEAEAHGLARPARKVDLDGGRLEAVRISG